MEEREQKKNRERGRETRQEPQLRRHNLETLNNRLNAYAPTRLSENQSMKAKPATQDVNSETEEASAADLGPNSAGQSGDIQGLSDAEDAGSESVKELLEEGQYYEASVMSGIENAPLADAAEVTTRQFAEDDVPEEYLEEDEPPR